MEGNAFQFIAAARIAWRRVNCKREGGLSGGAFKRMTTPWRFEVQVVNGPTSPWSRMAARAKIVGQPLGLWRLVKCTALVPRVLKFAWPG
jgi:hypothetical protein